MITKNPIKKEQWENVPLEEFKPKLSHCRYNTGRVVTIGTSILKATEEGMGWIDYPGPRIKKTYIPGIGYTIKQTRGGK